MRVSPLFAAEYRKLIRRVTAGEKLVIDAPEALEQSAGKPLDKNARQEKIQALKNLLQ